MDETAVSYVGFWRRSLAAFLDNIVWLIFYGWFYGSIVNAAYDADPEAGLILFFVYASLWFNYFAVCEWRWGQTIGKNATGIEVRSLDGKEKLTFGQASIRNLLRLVDFFFIGELMVIVTKRKQRLGDKAAKTVVVRRPPKVQVAAAVAGAAAPPSASATPVTAQPKAPAEPKPAPSRLPKVPWTPGDTLWGLIGGLVLAVIVAPLLVLPFDSDLSSDGALLAAQALLAGSLAVVAVGMASSWKFSPVSEALERLGLRPFKPSALGIALLTLFAYYIAAAIFATIVLEPKQEDIGGELGIGEGILVTTIAIFLIAAVSPVCEELFFRGFVFAGLRSRWSLWPAALVSGLVFGLVHAPTGITTVIPLAGLGVALCWLYNRTGSLWPCVLVHVVNNALALALIS
jgi:membrane protease YdiL (CAAX protease family)